MSLIFDWGRQRTVLAPPALATARRTQIRDAALALRDVDVTQRIITGQGSNRAEDAIGDVVEPDGIDLTRFRANAVLLKDHDHPAPIGVVTRDWIAGDGWWVTARLFDVGVSPAADQAWREIVSGGRRGLSVGFVGLEWEPRTTSRGGQGVRWKRIALHELSSVVLPACPHCLLSSHKGVGHRCVAAAGRSDEVVLVLDDELPLLRPSSLHPGVWVGRSAAGARALEARLRGGRR